MRLTLLALILAALLAMAWPNQPKPGSSPISTKVSGLTFVAPRDTFRANPMEAIQATGAGWIAVVPYAFHRPGEDQVRYAGARGRWWGESPEGARNTIHRAHEAGLKVMLKPQVWVPGGWPGDIDFASEEAWQKWEDSYAAYILPMSEIAEQEGAELFCIGTEFRQSAIKRPQFWKDLAGEIRKRYKGQLTYAANWDDFTEITFWGQLDFIGINAYFPLNETANPDKTELMQAWKPRKAVIKGFSKKQKKPVLFTEFGYLSVDGCAGKTWELEKQLPQLNANQQAQATAYDALLRSFWEEPYWAGGFVWKWYPEADINHPRMQKDYTPQGKLAEQVLKAWYD